jgi:hypothetical protein
VYLGAARKFLVRLRGDDQQVVVRVGAGAIDEWPTIGQEVTVSWDLEHGVLVRDEDADATPAGPRPDPGVAEPWRAPVGLSL